MARLKVAVRAGVLGLGFLCTTAAPVLAQQLGQPRVINNQAGETISITAFDDGLRRNKYLVQTEGSRNYWYADGGSANAGAGESGRKTTTQEWCRVRYLYGHDVRIPACWGEFMYSSHLITGLDGTHYELWFSPSSLSYFKIRNQETGLWYAHDGSANDGALRTTKADWCRIIFYHMHGIIKRPKECDSFAAEVTNALVGNRGPVAQKEELAYVRASLGTPPRYNKSGELTEVQSRAIGAGLGLIPMGAEEGVSRLAEGSIKHLDFERGKGFLANKVPGKPPSARLQAGTAVTGLVVGVAVDYSIDKIKDATGLRAQDANAGWIAAETISTTVAGTAITTAIMTASGATFNPVVAGVGLAVAGTVATVVEIEKASSDTGIRFEANYGGHQNYNRDLNDLTDRTFANVNAAGTFAWEPCAREGERCAFNGLRSVFYGVLEPSPNGGKQAGAGVDGAFRDGVDCTNAAAGKGKDPAPGVVKTCYVAKLNWDRRESYFVKQHDNATIWFQIDSTRYCHVQNMGAMNAYGGPGQVRVVTKLDLRGTNEGACAFPNGFYQILGGSAVYFLSGADKTGRGGPDREVGERACAIPSMAVLNNEFGVNMTAVYGVPAGSDLHRFRRDMGSCVPGYWLEGKGEQGTDVADGWAITRTAQSGNFTIVRLNRAENAFVSVPGHAVRIGGTPEHAWVAQTNGDVFRWVSNAWEFLPGRKATDVGDGWIVSNEPAPGGYKVYRYDFVTKAWVDGGGGATRIGGTYADPWVVTVDGDVFQRVSGKWESRPGVKASDVGQGWAILATAKDGGHIVRYNTSSQAWESRASGPQHAIGGSSDYPSIIGPSAEGHKIFFRR